MVQTAGDNKSCTTHDLLHVPREQASWRHGHIGSGEFNVTTLNSVKTCIMILYCMAYVDIVMLR